MSKIEEKRVMKNINNYIMKTKKVAFLIFAIILMSFAQALLSYTSRIGMAPIDSLIKSAGMIFGIEYHISNYFAVFILVTVAIILSKPKDRLITSTAFVTGYFLAIFVTIFIKDVIIYFPGLEYSHDVGMIKNGPWTWWGVLWFFVGWLSLVISIGIWINVGFGLRPYDVLLIKMSEMFPKHGYIFYRNILDLSFVLISLAAVSLSLVTSPNFGSNDEEALSWISRNSVSFGTIFFVIATGYATNWTKKLFSRIV